MDKVTYLGELEQMLLWAVLRLDDRAYGLAVRDELEATAGRSVARGAVYTTLDRLVRKGYLESWLADADESRAGRPRRYFRITPDGQRALREARAAFESLWTGLEDAVEERSR
ncbi:MAG: PadR family transcriptional regulator [Acidobacteria bacterium]|nr:PadR family transcriptional regulator [Acidobacteriota bacterium]